MNSTALLLLPASLGPLSALGLGYWTLRSRRPVEQAQVKESTASTLSTEIAALSAALALRRTEGTELSLQLSESVVVTKHLQGTIVDLQTIGKIQTQTIYDQTGKLSAQATQLAAFVVSNTLQATEITELKAKVAELTAQVTTLLQTIADQRVALAGPADPAALTVSDVNAASATKAAALANGGGTAEREQRELSGYLPTGLA